MGTGSRSFKYNGEVYCKYFLTTLTLWLFWYDL